MPSKKISTEVAVIGSGPGGAITGLTLAEAGFEVTIFEEGGDFPVNRYTAFSISEMKAKYRNGGVSTTLGKPGIAYVEGSCVGGGSEVNSGVYHRAPARILQNWTQKYKVGDLSLEDEYEYVEDLLSIEKEPAESQAQASLALKIGGEKLGWETTNSRRWLDYRMDNDGRTQLRRRSMSVVTLPMAKKLGAKLHSRCPIIKIKASKDSWHLVGRSPDGPVHVKAKYVFICAGAIQSPHILQKSGLAPAICHGIQVHPFVKLAAVFSEVINSGDQGIPFHQVKLPGSDTSFGCSISSKPYLSLSLKNIIDQDIWRQMAAYYAMICPETNGKILSIPGVRTPLVHYRLTQRDRHSLREGFVNLCRLLFQAGAVEIRPFFSKPISIKNERDVESVSSKMITELANLTSVHLSSSLPMGELPSCPVDSHGKVKGQQNLYVNDASILCSAPGVNPQGAIMAVCRRNARHFLEMNR